MIELKVYVPQDGPYGLVPEEGGAPVEEETCYLKSEVDKVIEELKHQRDGAFGLDNLGITLDDLSQMAKKETDHQKYKRCKAIARWCFTKSNYHFVVGRSEGGKTGMAHFHISCFYSKWYKRWLKIAEKFKEAMPIEVKTYKEAESGNSKRED